MVRITVYRLYSAEDAVRLAEEPDLLVSRIRVDRQRSPMAVIECHDAVLAAAVIDVLSGAFGVVIMDIQHNESALEPAHPLLDQGRAMLKDAKKVLRSRTGLE